MFHAAAISVGATISSVALAPAATSAGTALDGRVDVLEERERDRRVPASGTRLETASPMNASVPSEPTSSRRKISSGASASRNAHSR